MRRLSLFAMMFLALAVEACSGGGSPGGPTPTPTMTVPPVVTASYTFAPGNASATIGTAWDIVGIKTTLTGSGQDLLGDAYDHLQVDVTFTQDISHALPAPGTTAPPDGSLLGVKVSIDSDANPSTGSAGVCSPARPNVFPFDYYTDTGIPQPRLSDGNYTIFMNGVAIYSGPPNPEAEAVTSLSGHVLSYTFNLSTLGVFSGAKAPRIGVAAAAFNPLMELATDCVPTGANGVDELFTVGAN